MKYFETLHREEKHVPDTTGSNGVCNFTDRRRPGNNLMEEVTGEKYGDMAGFVSVKRQKHVRKIIMEKSWENLLEFRAELRYEKASSLAILLPRANRETSGRTCIIRVQVEVYLEFVYEDATKKGSWILLEPMASSESFGVCGEIVRPYGLEHGA